VKSESKGKALMRYYRATPLRAAVSIISGTMSEYSRKPNEPCSVKLNSDRQPSTFRGRSRVAGHQYRDLVVLVVPGAGIPPLPGENDALSGRQVADIE
jgi:hypothetical protein